MTSAYYSVRPFSPSSHPPSSSTQIREISQGHRDREELTNVRSQGTSYITIVATLYSTDFMWFRREW